MTRSSSSGFERSPERPGTFSAQDFSRLFGVPETRVRSWESRGLLTPSPYGFADLVSVRTLAELRGAGLSERRIFGIWKALRELLPHVKHPFCEVRLSVLGSSRVLVQYQRKLFDARGQLVLRFEDERRGAGGPR